MAHSLYSSPNCQSDKINDKKEEWVIHFAGIKENDAKQEFDQKTSIKGTFHEIQAQIRENNIKISSYRL
jgi:hypothetical protein